MKRQSGQLGFACLMFFLAATVRGDPASLPNRIEAEGPLFKKPAGVQIIDDANASGGKAVQFLGEKKAVLSDTTEVSLPPQKPGLYVLKVRMKVQDAYDIGRAWRIDVLDGKDILNYGVAQGYYFKGAPGYKDFEAPFSVLTSGVALTVKMYWAFDDWYPPCTSSPKVVLDFLEWMRLSDLPPLQIERVRPDKLRYLRREKGNMTVTVRNTTDKPISGRLVVHLSHDLQAPVVLAEQMVDLKPDEKRDIGVPIVRAEDESADYGYEVRASAIIQDKTVDSATAIFTVSDNPHAVATTWGPFTGENDPRDPAMYSFNNRWPRRFSESKISDADAVQGALEAREDYITMWEFGRGHVTLPGGCMGMAPKEDFWVDDDSGKTIGGKARIQKCVAELKKHGIAAISYSAPFSQGMGTLKLIHEHPDWFATSLDTKDFSGYDVAVFDQRAAFLKAHDLSTIPTNNGYMSPELGSAGCPAYFNVNFAKPEVLEYAIDRMIASIRMFGWDGVRWDCGHLNTGAISGPWQPLLDFYGKPLCNSPAEMEAQTVANIRRYKERTSQEHPPVFAFGSNFGSVEETHRYPEMTRELCRGGGWLLDEVSQDYSSLQSAYRFWDKYYAVMSQQGNYVAAMGGHYNPFAPTRFGSRYPAERIYTTVFMLAGHGHPQLMFRNSCFVTGDPAQFAVRFGRYLFDTSLLAVEKPESLVQVTSVRPVWWNKSVLRKNTPLQDMVVVHLINPPVGKAIGDNATSALPAPIRNITISCAVPEGRKKTTAWALTAESWASGQDGRTQAVPLEVVNQGARVKVTLPELLIWKMVVLQFE